jgi:hypothetical protein
MGVFARFIWWKLPLALALVAQAADIDIRDREPPSG